MARDRYGLTPRDRLSLDAAKLYHAGGLSQQEIAQTLHVSRPTVSKLVATARERGFVRTLVADPRESDAALISELQEHFRLAELRLVVPVGRGPMDNRYALGSGAAEMLGAHLSTGEDVLGFWWSDAIHAVTEAMGRQRLRPRALVQLNGTDPGVEVDAALAAFTARSAVPVHPYPFPILHDSVAARLDAENDPASRQVLALRAECAAVVFGAETPAATALHRSPLLSAEDRRHIEDHAVGQICGRYIDAEGRIVAPSLSQRTLGPTLSELRRLRRTVLVTSGLEMLPLIRAALENRYANHLVTDLATATTLADTL